MPKKNRSGAKALIVYGAFFISIVAFFSFALGDLFYGFWLAIVAYALLLTHTMINLMRS